ncbi:MAG: dihydroorotate dehydrogenase-like protein, partial [Gracilimonas sp.]
MDLSVKYLGLKLRNPLVVSASPLTSTVENIKACEEEGIGAVVLRSLFEEEINAELEGKLDNEDMYFWYPEAADHIKKLSKKQVTLPYLKLIEKAKQETSIPIIASVNCFSAGSWVKFARNIQKAGADALELNLATHIPHDDKIKEEHLTQTLTAIVKNVKKKLDIPVAVKIGHYYSNIIGTACELERAGADGLVIFNRFYRPDIDIESMEVISDNTLSSPKELTYALRWVGVLSQHVSCDIAASTGIHDYQGVVKQLLAGATVTQICSVLYLKGIKEISQILKDLEVWMDKKRFESVDDFRGKITDSRLNSAKFEQLQFIQKTHKA